MRGRRIEAARDLTRREKSAFSGSSSRAPFSRLSILRQWDTHLRRPDSGLIPELAAGDRNADPMHMRGCAKAGPSPFEPAISGARQGKDQRMTRAGAQQRKCATGHGQLRVVGTLRLRLFSTLLLLSATSLSACTALARPDRVADPDAVGVIDSVDRSDPSHLRVQLRGVPWSRSIRVRRWSWRA
jgi:hypothetical protein